MSELLQKVWDGCMCQLAVAEAPAAAGWAAIAKAYSRPGRHYHTLVHLDCMAKILAEHHTRFTDEAVAWMALFFHDIVYTPTRNNNEAQSAGEARRFLQQSGQPADFIDRVERLILATKRHESTGNFDIDLFTDADLAILGANWPQYEQYTRQIRKEYRMYPNFLYQPGRIKVLEHFLQMPFIFKTPAMRERFEQQALENLNKELNLLRGKTD